MEKRMLAVAESQKKMSRMYLSGDGVSQNKTRSAYWLLKSFSSKRKANAR